LSPGAAIDLYSAVVVIAKSTEHESIQLTLEKRGDSKLVEGLRGDMGEAACPYEEVSKTRVKVADLMRSLLARPFILSLPPSLSLSRAVFTSITLSRPFNRPPFETDRGNRLSAKERAAPIPSLSKVSWIIDCFARARFPSSRRCPAVVLFLPRERSVP